MTSLLLILFLALNPVYPSPDTDTVLVYQSKRQADHYIEQLQKSDQDVYLWALARLSQSDAEVKSYISESIKNLDFENAVLDIFKNDEMSYTGQLKKLAFLRGSPPLYIELLLHTGETKMRVELKEKFEKEIGYPESSPIDYKQLSDKIINSEAVTVDILPVERFSLVHFFLLYYNDSAVYRILPANYLESLTIKWVKNDPVKTGHHLIQRSLYEASLFRGFYLLSQYEKTHDFYSYLIDDNLIPNSSLRLRMYQALEYSMYRIGYYDKCLNTIRKFSLPLAKLTNNRLTELNLLVNHGAYLNEIGKITAAQSYYLQVREKAEEYGISLTQGDLFSRYYNNLGITYLKSGELDKYLDHLFKALAFTSEIKDENKRYSHQLGILRNIYIYYKKINDYKSALSYLTNALKLAKENKNKIDLGSIYILLGKLHMDMDKDYQKSLVKLEKAGSLLDENDNYTLYKRLLAIKAQLFEKMGNSEKALDLFSKIEKLAEGKDDPGYIEALFDQARIHLTKNRTEKAEPLIARAKEKNLDHLDFKDIVKTRRVEAEYLVQTEQKKDAIDILAPTVNQIVEWAKNSTELESGYWNIEDEFLNTFELYADLLIEHHREEEVVAVLDQLKTINDAALYQNDMVRSSVLNEQELADYQRITNQLEQLRKNLLSAPENRQAEIQANIDRLSAKKRVLVRKITELADRQPVSIRTIQQQINGRELIWHITELNGKFYIAEISRTDVNIRKIALSDEIRQLFTSAINEMAAGNTDLLKFHRIATLLEVDHIPGYINKLYLIPDSYLYQLPLDVLPVTRPTSAYSYGDPTYLIENHEIQYLTSLNDMITGKTGKKSHTLDFAGYGIAQFDDAERRNLMSLPHASKEVNLISDALNNVSKKKTFINNESTEQAFKQSAPQARVVHLATHSEVSERDPLYSTIYMSGSGKIDEQAVSGRIFAYELFELHLGNDLIMFNSCESGSGDYLQGAGVMGISRALRYAGAQSVVLNIWSVNDAMASDFAVKFYQSLNQGKSKTASLRDAKLHFLKQKNANPHYWGPYMMLGNNTPIVRPYRTANLMIAGFFTLCVIALMAVGITRNGVKREPVAG